MKHIKWFVAAMVIAAPAYAYAETAAQAAMFAQATAALHTISDYLDNMVTNDPTELDDLLPLLRRVTFAVVDSTRLDIANSWLMWTTRSGTAYSVMSLTRRQCEAVRTVLMGDALFKSVECL
jgi:RNase P/RNase MRP subunit POP5